MDNNRQKSDDVIQDGDHSKPAVNILQALRKALIEEMDNNKNVVLLGEDIAVFGGSYRVTEGLLDRYGPQRVCDTPISENGIVGIAIGAAMTGLRPVVEIQFNDFLLCAMDQICNHAAKLRLMTGGQVKIPLVIRSPYGATGRAAQHSQSLEALFMHIPGLKIIMPSTPYDAKGLLKAAIRDDNPVLCFEHKLLYGATSPGGKAKTAITQVNYAFKSAPAEEYCIPLGIADIKKEGKDISMVATGYMVHKCLEVAYDLESQGVSAEVIDLRTLIPLDKETILNSVKKTGRLVIISEDVLTCGVTAEIAAIISERAIKHLKTNIIRVATKDTPIPFAPSNEADALVGIEDIRNAVMRSIS